MKYRIVTEGDNFIVQEPFGWTHWRRSTTYRLAALFFTAANAEEAIREYVRLERGSGVVVKELDL